MNRFTAAILSDPKIIACMSLVPENCVSQSLKTEEYPTVDQIAERGILPKIAYGIHNKNIPEGILKNDNLSHRILLAMNIWIDFNETCNFVCKFISRSCRNGTIIQYHHMTVPSLYEVILFHWYILKYIKRLTKAYFSKGNRCHNFLHISQTCCYTNHYTRYLVTNRSFWSPWYHIPVRHVGLLIVDSVVDSTWPRAT